MKFTPKWLQEDLSPYDNQNRLVICNGVVILSDKTIEEVTKELPYQLRKDILNTESTLIGKKLTEFGTEKKRTLTE